MCVCVCVYIYIYIRMISNLILNKWTQKVCVSLTSKTLCWSGRVVWARGGCGFPSVNGLGFRV